MDNNQRIAKEIMEKIGGQDNIATLTNCMTRIRVGVKDESQVDIDGLKKIQGVMGVIKAIGIYQIVVGKNSIDVYRAMTGAAEVESAKNAGEKEENAEDKPQKQPEGRKTFKDIVGNVVATVAACVSPVIPAIVTSGLISAFLSLAVQLFGLSRDSNTYYIFNTAGNVALYFLPVFCAYAAAKRFQCSRVLALFMACLMLHPNYTALVGAGEAVTLFGLSMDLVSYSSSLFPIILTVWLLSYVEKMWSRILPKAFRYVPVPVLTVAVMIPVMFLVTGPLGSVVGDILAGAVSFVYGKAPALGIVLMGILAPILVLTGSHLTLIPIAANNFAAYGYDNMVYVAFIGMNFSQVGVAAACMLKAKTSEIRQEASGALISALTGITEPSLYGLGLRLKKPLIATFAATIANALYCMVFNVRVFSMAGPSFLTLPIYIDPAGSNNFVFAMGAIAVTIVTAFAVTWILGFNENPEKG